MIDAYEIGIQLLLQDDVSAGLQVINRELAEVDRAIAATSAKLVTLNNQAGAVGGVAVSKAAPTPVSGASAREDIIDLSTGERTAPGEPRGASGPTAIPMEPRVEAAPLSEPMARRQREEPTSPMAGLQERSDPSPPVLLGVPDQVQGAAVSPQRAAAPEELNAPAIAPVVMDGTTRPSESAGSSAPVSRVDDDVPTVSTSAQSSPASRTVRTNEWRADVALASTGRSLATDAPPKTNVIDRRREPARVADAIRQRSTAAPWPKSESRSNAADGAFFQDRATAPVGTGQDRGTSAGGTVMLDGRLVGQWLSDHMARQASRPPGGTSFFDPRQSPAWTISGAI